MRLRKPCEHGRWEAHLLGDPDSITDDVCPGGEFLVEGSIVVEKESDSEWWPKWAVEAVQRSLGNIHPQGIEMMLDALASQVGESG